VDGQPVGEAVGGVLGSDVGTTEAVVVGLVDG
jgi:hypothetical protein